MKEIFEKEFILKVLTPLAAVMAYAAITFLFAPFLLLLGMLVFAVLFLFSNYSNGRLEKELSYNDEDTNPLGNITNQVNQQTASREPATQKKSLKDKLKMPGKKKRVAEPQPVYRKAPEPVQQEQPRKPVKKKVVRKVVKKKEAPTKQSLNYDDDFEFEFGNYDE